MQTKLPVKSRVADKYQPMLTYYAELIGLCHETVTKTESLKMLDPMGKKLLQHRCLLEFVKEWTNQ
jgi:hypothetical protein